MLMDHIPRCPLSWYVIQLHDRSVHVLEKFMLEAGATKGRDLRLAVRRIWSGASRDRHGGVVLLDFMAPHSHLVVDVTVTSARTNTTVLRIGARLPLHGSFALGAHHCKLDADLRTYALLCTPSVRSIHDYYPFAMEDGGRLAPTAAELVDRIVILMACRRFPSMGDVDSRSLRFDSYVRMHHFVLRSTSVPFRRFSAALHGTLGSYLRDALQEGSADAAACLPAFLRFFPLFLFLLGSMILHVYIIVVPVLVHVHVHAFITGTTLWQRVGSTCTGSHHGRRRHCSMVAQW
jgi:hypothetical protein